ncbi:MAG: quinoprotein dehydrogenase-associated putative ABC transporter substrate-binding protein, partial [Mesorhizobium sp.]
CDIIMGYAQGDELVQNTNAYYRSSYVLVHPKGNGMEGVETIEDPKLTGKKIGVVESTPPTANMAANKLLRTAKIYPLVKEKTGSRMSYRITMGVRPSDQEWKRTLNRVIRENQAEINRILLDYNVPLIDEHDNPITQ